jgi:hypothetical protein
LPLNFNEKDVNDAVDALTAIRANPVDVTLRAVARCSAPPWGTADIVP